LIPEHQLMRSIDTDSILYRANNYSRVVITLVTNYFILESFRGPNLSLIIHLFDVKMICFLIVTQVSHYQYFKSISIQVFHFSVKQFDRGIKWSWIADWIFINYRFYL